MAQKKQQLTLYFGKLIVQKVKEHTVYKATHKTGKAYSFFTV